MTKRLRAKQTNKIVIDLTEYSDYTIVSEYDRITIIFAHRLNNLAYEILDEILRYLSIGDIINIEQTSKGMQKSIKAIYNKTRELVVAIQKSMKYPKKIYDDWVYREKTAYKIYDLIQFQGYVHPITLTLPDLMKQSYIKLIKINELITEVSHYLNQLITKEDIFLNKKGERVYYSKDGDILHFSECNNLNIYQKGFKEWMNLHQYLLTLGLVEPGKVIEVY
jgi:hypothetical protein